MAHELGCRRVLHVSGTLALGDSGRITRDESYTRQSQPRNHHEWSKAEAHRIALSWRARGLPVMLACPNSVIGANDHSTIGYLFRLYLNKLLPPLASGLDHITSQVWVDDLAHGLASAALYGEPGDSWLFCGERLRYRDIYALWARHPGGARQVWQLPAPLAMALLGPTGLLLRALGLPAFASAEALRAGAIDLDYSARHARQSLAWEVTPAERVWETIGAEEASLQSARRGQGLIQRLRPMAAS